LQDFENTAYLLRAKLVFSVGINNKYQSVEDF